MFPIITTDIIPCRRVFLYLISRSANRTEIVFLHETLGKFSTFVILQRVRPLDELVVFGLRVSATAHPRVVHVALRCTRWITVRSITHHHVTLFVSLQLIMELENCNAHENMGPNMPQNDNDPSGNKKWYRQASQRSVSWSSKSSRTLRRLIRGSVKRNSTLRYTYVRHCVCLQHTHTCILGL